MASMTAKQFERYVFDRTTRNMETAMVHLEGQVKRKLSQAGSGREYQRRSVTHRASAPGAPPAPDTGNLRSSIKHRVDIAGTTITGVVGAMGKGDEPTYAVALEFGSPGRNLAARPFLRPTLQEEKVKIATILGKR